MHSENGGQGNKGRGDDGIKTVKSLFDQARDWARTPKRDMIAEGRDERLVEILSGLNSAGRELWFQLRKARSVRGDKDAAIEEVKERWHSAWTAFAAVAMPSDLAADAVENLRGLAKGGDTQAEAFLSFVGAVTALSGSKVRILEVDDGKVETPTEATLRIATYVSRRGLKLEPKALLPVTKSGLVTLDDLLAAIKKGQEPRQPREEEAE